MEKATASLRTGGVGILATDTIYGLVGQAVEPTVVERIYQLKQSTPDKPLIILIGDMADLAKFDIQLQPSLGQQLNQYWPGPVSIILPCLNQQYTYLHRGTNSLAFRLPAKPTLRRLLTRTGPLVAPSANPEGQPPAGTVAEAQAYFGDQVDFYLPGRIGTKPSRVIRLTDNRFDIIRP